LSTVIDSDSFTTNAPSSDDGITSQMGKVGIIIIGRNEGERLRRCLMSIASAGYPMVYVDSASEDGSSVVARGLGAQVVDLDMSNGFSAARARNEGVDWLLKEFPDTEFIQFVDGDCEVASGWFCAALHALSIMPEVAIVAGRLNERFPQVSIYNRLADFEWNSSGFGAISAVGGIFLIRRNVFQDVGGFNASVTAGEEPELCQRVRNALWGIVRLDTEMAWHDLGMTQFRQWWRRQVRGGYGGLDVARRFGLETFRRNGLRARFWSTLPLLALLVGYGTSQIAGQHAGYSVALLILALWPAQLIRIAVRTWRNGAPIHISLAHAYFTLISFWPQMWGQLVYFSDSVFAHKNPRLIEYKSSQDSVAQSSVERGAVQ
jgi:hypothetical protein